LHSHSQELNESIAYLKTALNNIRDVVTNVSKEIEMMSAPKAAKKEIAKALMMNVSALSSNLQVESITVDSAVELKE
jgi:hypothetical protein